MDRKTLEEKIRDLHKSSGEVASALEATFGEDFFNQDITEQIGSYEDACAYLQKEPVNEAALLAAGATAKQIAGIKLEDITLALNEGKPTDIYNGQQRWYPVFWTKGSPAAFAFVYSDYGSSSARAGSGARLSYHEKRVSDYSGTKFSSLWQEYLS